MTDKRKSLRHIYLTFQIQREVSAQADSYGNYESKVALKSSLRNFLLIYFKLDIYIVGSTYSNLALSGDSLSLVYVEKADNDREITQDDILKKLKISPDFKNAQKLLYDVQSDCDGVYTPSAISFKSQDLLMLSRLVWDDGSQIRTNHLINCYLRLDERVRPLIMFVRIWWHNVGPTAIGLKELDLMLMVIYYLQVGCNPWLLPCLSKDAPEVFHHKSNIYKLKRDIPLPKYDIPNKQLLSELFISFLDYYANKFDFKTQAVSVRTGRSFKINQSHRFSEYDFICIEDPFTRKNTWAKMVSSKKPLSIKDFRTHVKSVFKNSHASLARSFTVDESFVWPKKNFLFRKVSKPFINLHHRWALSVLQKLQISRQ